MKNISTCFLFLLFPFFSFAQFADPVDLNSEINFNFFEIQNIYIFDVDNDGYKDVFVAYQYDVVINWHKNEDGLGQFGPQIPVSTIDDWLNDLTIGDIDLDGDQDYIAAIWLADRVFTI